MSWHLSNTRKCQISCSTMKCYGKCLILNILFFMCGTPCAGDLQEGVAIGTVVLSNLIFLCVPCYERTWKKWSQSCARPPVAQISIKWGKVTDTHLKSVPSVPPLELMFTYVTNDLGSPAFSSVPTDIPGLCLSSSIWLLRGLSA